MGKAKTQARIALNQLSKMWVEHELSSMPLAEREEFIEFTKTKEFKRIMKKKLPAFTEEALKQLELAKENENGS